MKVLVIRFSSIGDIVLATPVMRCLKQQKGAEVHFLTKLSMKAVTEHNPYIDRFFYFNNNLSGIIHQLKAERYDYIIDLHRNFRTFRIKSSLRKVQSYSYSKLSVQKFLLTKLGINLMPQRHITLRSLDTVAPLGVVDDGKGLDYFIGEKDMVKPSDLPMSHVHGYMAIVIGASYFTKKLPVHKLQQLCRQLAYPVVLVGGKEDQKEGEAIAAIDPIQIYNACGKFSLNESADIIRNSKLVISHDTGMQYIASAYQKKTIAIWGGTSPKLEVEPFYGTANPIANQLFRNSIVPGLKCQPCSNYGTRKCPLGHFKCMELQDTGQIAKDALTMK